MEGGDKKMNKGKHWKVKDTSKMKGRTPWNKVEKIKLNCGYCGKIFEVIPSRKDTARFCSKHCRAKVIVHPRELSRFIGEKAIHWKGERVGYRGIHHWVQVNLGKANKCSECGKEGTGRQIHWANKDHKYKRNLEDWISLCIQCHGRYDQKMGYRRHTIKYHYIFRNHCQNRPRLRDYRDIIHAGEQGNGC